MTESPTTAAKDRPSHRDAMEALPAYRCALKEYTKAVAEASQVSREAMGLEAGSRRYWASVVYTRLVIVAQSVLFICPESVLNEGGLLWDFGSVAALVRAVFETTLMLFYIGLEEVTEDEWRFRMDLMHLHDCTERLRLFHGTGNFEEIAGFTIAAVGLREKITANPAFAMLAAGVRKELLTGEKATAFGKGQILARMGKDASAVLNFYRFISNYVHNMPLGFHRTGLHKRDGTLNERDVAYSTTAIVFAQSWVEEARDLFRQAFSDKVTFSSAEFDLTTLRRKPFTAADIKAIDRVFHAVNR